MKIYCKRTCDNHLIPLDEYSLEELKKVKLNKEVEVEVVQKRNIGYHRKFFVMLQLIFDIQSHFEAFDPFRDWITMRAGFVERYKAPNGVDMYRPKSISFAKMDQIEFEQLYSKVIDVALQHDKICGGIKKEDLLKEYESKILSFV